MTRLPNPTPSISLHAKLPLHHCGRAFRKEQQPVHPHALQQLQPRIPPSSKCDPSAPLVSQSSVAITFHLLTSIIIVLAVASRHLLTTCPRLFQSDSCIRHSPPQARLLHTFLHTWHGWPQMFSGAEAPSNARPKVPPAPGTTHAMYDEDVCNMTYAT